MAKKKVSNKMKLTKENMIKVLKGLGIAAGSVILTELSAAITAFDYGEWTPIVYMASAALINLVRKYLSDE